MKNLFLLCLLLILQVHTSMAQNFCGTNVADQQKSLDAQKKLNTLFKRTDIVLLPLQIHNVGNDQGTGFLQNWVLYESLDRLNKDFTPTGFQFFLESDIQYIAKTSYNDHDYSSGERMMRENNVPNVINSYLVANPAGNCGYFTWNGDATAIGKNCVGKFAHTWAHELGHYFSLPHTFFGWEGINYQASTPTAEYQGQIFTPIENVDRNNCNTAADNFCDTYPDYLSYRWSCDQDLKSPYTQKDIYDEKFKSDGSLFMSYASDMCMQKFSDEQMNAMHLNLNGRRTDLMRNNIKPIELEQKNITAISPIDSSDQYYKQVLFSWDKIDGAKKYLFQLSRTATMSTIVANLELDKPYVVIDTLAANKNYYWRVKAVNDFYFGGADSKIYFFRSKDVHTASNDITNDSEISLYPNPSSTENTIVIKLLQHQDINELSIRDLYGKQMIGHHIEKINNNMYGLQCPGFSAGIYFLQIRTSSKTIIKKFQIKN